MAAFAVDLFRRGVGRSADEAAALPFRRRPTRRPGGQATRPKSSTSAFRRTPVREIITFGLQVAVHDPERMRRAQRVEDLRHQVNRLKTSRRPSRSSTSQRRPRHELRTPRRAGPASVSPESIRRTMFGCDRPPQSLHLAAEALRPSSCACNASPPGAAPDGHALPGRELPCLVDGAEAARPQTADQLIATRRASRVSPSAEPSA